MMTNDFNIEEEKSRNISKSSYSHHHHPTSNTQRKKGSGEGEDGSTSGSNSSHQFRDFNLYVFRDFSSCTLNFLGLMINTVINLFPRAAFPPGSNSSYSRLGQVAGEPAAGVRSLDCCDLGPAAGVRRLGRPQGFPPDPGEKQHGGFYWESYMYIVYYILDHV